MFRDPNKYRDFDIVKEINSVDLVSYLGKGLRVRSFFTAIYYLTFLVLTGFLLFQLYQIQIGRVSLAHEIL